MMIINRLKTVLSLNTGRHDTSVRLYQVFLLNFIIALLAFSYYIFKNDGILILCNDYNQQQIEFNIFAHNAIRSGNIFYNWQTDIGSEFIPSFSFYLLGSPFFWLTMLFPARLFPYLAIWIYMLKYGVAGLTSFIYLKKFTKDPRYALAGSVMYAFSGFQATNLIFYHFHDAVAFLPLLLTGIEDKIRYKRNGYFALFCAINALVNWNFFFGEALFCILYYICRKTDVSQKTSSRETSREIFSFIAEGITGFGVSAVISLPSIISVMQNNRLSNHLSIKDSLLFPLNDYLLMLRGFIMPAEPMTNPSTLTVNNFYSIAAWLPLCGCCGCAAFMITRNLFRWLKLLLSILAVIAIIPLLNSIFMLFNAEPYRRWYFMLVLMMCAATVIIIENAAEDKASRSVLILSIIVNFAAVVLFVLLLTFISSPETPDGKAIVNYRSFSISAFLTCLCLGLFLFIVASKRSSALRIRLLLAGIAVSAGLSTFSVLLRYSMQCDWDGLSGLKTGYSELVTSLSELDQDILPYRYTIFNPYFNRGLSASLPSTNSFLSTVDGGIFDLYEALGSPRRVIALDTPDGTEELLASRYYVTKFETDSEGLTLTGVYPYETGNIYLYERDYYLPAAFTYKKYMLSSEFKRIAKEERAIAMMHALVVRDEDESEVRDYLVHADTEADYNRKMMLTDIQSHQQDLPCDFSFTTYGLSFTVNCTEDEFVFMSVPYSGHWKAYDNENRIRIFNINGLSAVPVRSGTHRICLQYDLDHNIAGLCLSVVCILILGTVLLTNKKKLSK